MAIGWGTVSTIAERVVAEHLTDERLDSLVRLGVE
jgi:hypothetical protein